MPAARTPHSKVITRRLVQIIDTILKEETKIENQVELANILGIHPSVISRWRRNAGSCTLDDVVNICMRFHVNTGFILLGIGDMFLNPGKDLTKSRIENQLSDHELRLVMLEMKMEKAGTKTRNGIKKTAKNQLA